MLTRREFLTAAGCAAAWPHGAFAASRGVVVNDLHSQLTATRVNRVLAPTSLDAVRATLSAARADLRRHRVNGIYGTVRLIEAGNESSLA
jgi:hypothetical protein